MNQKQFLDLLSTMPPLHHTIPGHEFDENTSEIAIWLLAQPGIRNWLCAKAVNSERIKYNAETGQWSGVSRGPVGRPPSVQQTEN